MKSKINAHSKFRGDVHFHTRFGCSLHVRVPFVQGRALALYAHEYVHILEALGTNPGFNRLNSQADEFLGSRRARVAGEEFDFSNLRWRVFWGQETTNNSATCVNMGE